MQRFAELFTLGFVAIALTAGVAQAQESEHARDAIFDASANPSLPEGSVIGTITSLAFKKIPADDALNQWSVDFQTGAVNTSGGTTNGSTWNNLYLAFAVDVRYARNCFGTKTNALCTLWHSSIQASSNLSWSDPLSQPDQYTVVFVPVEFIAGTFSKKGLDLKTTDSALYVSVGAHAEALRDLGIDVQNRVLGLLSASLNYASADQALGTTLAFRWIGSIRLFGGAGSSEMAEALPQGVLSGGVETQIGLALDLEEGTIAFTNTSRLEGDVGVGGSGFHSGFSTDTVELKYLHSICRKETRNGCAVPRAVSFGGGVRYQYASASYEAQGATGAAFSADQSAHRLIFFAELARF